MSQGGPLRGGDAAGGGARAVRGSGAEEVESIRSAEERDDPSLASVSGGVRKDGGERLDRWGLLRFAFFWGCEGHSCKGEPAGGGRDVGDL